MLFLLVLFFTSIHVSQQVDPRGEVYDQALSLAKLYNSMRTKELIEETFKIPFPSDYCDGKKYNLMIDDMMEQVGKMTEEDWKKCTNEEILDAKYLDEQKQVIEFTTVDDATRGKISFTYVARKNSNGKFIFESEKCQNTN